eukprot:2930636-Lingulodinium_polyedra.AAC.1
MAAALAPGTGSCPWKAPPRARGKTTRRTAECTRCAYEDVPLQTHTHTHRQNAGKSHVDMWLTHACRLNCVLRS